MDFGSRCLGPILGLVLGFLLLDQTMSNVSSGPIRKRKLPGKNVLRILVIAHAGFSLSMRSVSPFPLQISGNSNLR